MGGGEGRTKKCQKKMSKKMYNLVAVQALCADDNLFGLSGVYSQARSATCTCQMPVSLSDSRSRSAGREREGPVSIGRPRSLYCILFCSNINCIWGGRVSFHPSRIFSAVQRYYYSSLL